MKASRPDKDEGASAHDAGTLEQNYQLSHFAHAIHGVKRFGTLQAHLAQAGFSMERTTAGYYLVAHWSQKQPHQALELATQFLRSFAP